MWDVSSALIQRLRIEYRPKLPRNVRSQVSQLPIAPPRLWLRQSPPLLIRGGESNGPICRFPPVISLGNVLSQEWHTTQLYPGCDCGSGWSLRSGSTNHEDDEREKPSPSSKIERWEPLSER